jgi:hypothetical protein
MVPLLLSAAAVAAVHQSRSGGAAALSNVTLPRSQSGAASSGVLGDIEGFVRSSNGPEVAVWVIAETVDRPTRLAKIVVTTDGGRYLIPDLPTATYRVWARGYGLLDSTAVEARPGQTVNLVAAVASTPREAAKIYPAAYWYSLIRPPAATEFPGTGPQGNGIAPELLVQSQWIDAQKQGCMLCHQMGDAATRQIDGRHHPSASTLAAWDRRVQQGRRGRMMNAAMNRFGRQRGLQMFADWSDQIAAGTVPPAPPRPEGIERNVVITMWEWGTADGFVYNAVASDKRNPGINPGAAVFGVDTQNDLLTILDPRTDRADALSIPTRVSPDAARATAYGVAAPHYPAMDQQGRLWFTTRVSSGDAPSWCGETKYGRYFRPRRGGMQAATFDPTTRQFALIDTCYGTHHLNFAEDSQQTLYLSGSDVLGWIDTRAYNSTHDERLTQGWCPLVLDTNGDGRISKPWNEPGPAGQVDPKLDTRLDIGTYAVVGDSKDSRTAWISSSQFPGRLVRVRVGANPPESCIAEMYEVPSVLDRQAPRDKVGFGPRGIDIDRDGVVWTALSGSSHLASFDRRKCKVTAGVKALEGRHCVEGWTLYPTPGPALAATDPPIGADYQHYNWVDQWDALGLGTNVPVAAGSNSDALLALIPNTGKWVVLRVPYPLGFFTRAINGRIDDRNAGWKGRGVWATYSTEVTAHIEGEQGIKPRVVKFQLRPGPLSR